MELAEWVNRYARAWETADEERIASLFTENALYGSSGKHDAFVDWGT